MGYPTEAPPPVPPPSLRPRLILASKILAGVLTLAATVVGTFIAITDRPDPYTMDDWNRKANAVCDQDFGRLQTPLYALFPLLSTAMASPPGQGDNTSLNPMITSVLQVSGAFREMTGDLRELDLPADADNDRINRLLDAGTQISNSLGTVATFLTNHQLGRATSAEGTATVAGLQQITTTTLPAWSNEVVALGLTQCLSIVGTLSPAPTPTGPTAAETALIRAIDRTTAEACTPNRAAEIGQVTAAVNCTAVNPGPTRQPLVMQFTDAAAMNAWIDALNAPTTNADCVDGKGRGTWYHDSVRMGSLVCRPQTDGVFRIIWAFEGRNVVAVADGADPRSTYTWWTDNATLLTAA